MPGIGSRSDELRALLAAIVGSSDDAIVSKTLDGGQHIFLIIADDRRAEEEAVLAALRQGERGDGKTVDSPSSRPGTADGSASRSASTRAVRPTAAWRSQEALHNLTKHARADSVDVVLEKSADNVSLLVEDHGIGFDASDTAGAGFGLIGMRERALLVGAEFQIESTRGRGKTVFVRVRAAAAGRKGA